MYQVFIADDEAIIREGLKCILDWEAHGFGISGEAADGEAACREILRLQPDVVLMDIRMPKMLGLDVIRTVMEQGFSGKIIILSGYTDFRYAQQAIRYGVQDYLTKPIDEDELARIVDSVRELLDRDRASRSQDRDALLHNILAGKADLSQLRPEALALSADIYQAVLCGRSKARPATQHSPAKPEPAFPFAALLHVANEENRFFESLTVQGNELFLLKGSYAVKKFSDLARRLKAGSKDMPPNEASAMEHFFLAYGEPVPSLAELPRSLREASDLFSRRFFCSENQHIAGHGDLPEALPAGTAMSLPSLSSPLRDEYAGKLVDYLQTANRDKIASTFEELQGYLPLVPNTIESVKLFLKDLYLRIREELRLLYPNKELPFSGNAEILRLIDESSYLYEILSFFTGQFEGIMDALGGGTRDSVLDDILRYISHNYAGNITLEGIAPLFGYNSAYLGKIFRKKVGQPFNSYVDQVRIERSKLLLQDPELKVYDVAGQVGYRSVDYFHVKFRKHVGQSPAEYRKSVAAAPAGEASPILSAPHDV